MMASKQRLRRGAKTKKFIIFLLVLIVGIFLAIPLVFSFMYAFKPFEEMFLYPPRFFVRRPTMDNFLSLFIIAGNSLVPFSRYIFNSISVSVISTVLHIVFAGMAAYPLAKHKFIGSKRLFDLVIWSLLFTGSGSVTAVPQYIIMAKIGLIDTYLALILPIVGWPLGLYLMKQFMDQVPVSMLDAARIDGANEMKTLWRIVMPSVKPAWMTLAILTFTMAWNSNGMGFVFSEEIKLLPAALSQISTGGIARMGAGAAASLLLTIPPLVFFIIAESSVVRTMTHAGIKG